MAVRGPKGTDPPPPLPQATEPERPAPTSTMPLAPRPRDDQRRQQHEEAAAQLSGEGRIGDPSLTPEEFASLGTLVAARHVMALLARKRRDVARASLLAEVGDLLLAQKDAVAIRRILLQMGEVGSIVDIYPLEVLDYVLQKRPGVLPGFAYGAVILNKIELEAETFAVEELIRIKVPLSLRMRAFALEGGGDPGYCFAPGPPAEYHLEVASPGDFRVLVRGEIRKKSLLDRVILRIAEGPDDGPRW
jgi:hypothetical protein